MCIYLHQCSSVAEHLCSSICQFPNHLTGCIKMLRQPQTALAQQVADPWHTYTLAVVSHYFKALTVLSHWTQDGGWPLLQRQQELLTVASASQSVSQSESQTSMLGSGHFFSPLLQLNKLFYVNKIFGCLFIFSYAFLCSFRTEDQGASTRFCTDELQCIKNTQERQRRSFIIVLVLSFRTDRWII